MLTKALLDTEEEVGEREKYWERTLLSLIPSSASFHCRVEAGVGEEEQ